ncbi:MAG TPA: hypothetical protein VJQ56_13255 [Blastocatellia bacterium]|nr:hypothetical protein [Blastocatellia bacterium]
MSAKTETTYGCERAIRELISYCRGEGWAGFDPYDGLNSPFAGATSFDNKLLRTVWTQAVKRSPFNLRPLLGIRKGVNPKGVALALRSVMLLAQTRIETDAAGGGFRQDFDLLSSMLAETRSREFEEACWGYNFDWQSRAFFAPRGTPNVVCTVFAAQAYLDWFEKRGNEHALDTALSSCRFLLDRVNRTEDCFSYTPLDHSQVHNVNLLAAELLGRAYFHTQRAEYREAAEKAVAFTAHRQHTDGSWPYGESASQVWKDSFHTGYVLVSLAHLMKYLGTDRWLLNLRQGFDFYCRSFFLADFTPKYYHDELYPIDVHSAAQAVVTFVEMAEIMPDSKTMAAGAVGWAINNLKDPRGFFYFQRHRFYTIKTPFIRWAQCWMLYALSLYLSSELKGENV